MLQLKLLFLSLPRGERQINNEVVGEEKAETKFE